MLEMMKAAFSRLSALAGAYLPPGFKDALLAMAHENDRLRVEMDSLRAEFDELKEHYERRQP